jgi:hypothetical protein
VGEKAVRRGRVYLYQVASAIPSEQLSFWNSLPEAVLEKFFLSSNFFNEASREARNRLYYVGASSPFLSTYKACFAKQFSLFPQIIFKIASASLEKLLSEVILRKA